MKQWIEEYDYENYVPYEIIDGVVHGEPDYEIIGGEKVLSPAPNPSHNTIMLNLAFIFTPYIMNKNINARIFGDNVDIRFAKEATYKPDFSVICNPDIINWEGAIHGAPDLAVEILSKSTKKYDFGIKKDVYEQYGVKEYWIINAKKKSIIVYHLVDGKFELNGEYKINSDKTSIKVSIFDDLIVDLNDIFKWLP